MSRYREVGDGLVPWRVIAAELGVSRQGAEVIAKRALENVRRACEARGVDARAFFDALTTDRPDCPTMPAVYDYDPRRC